jgi:3-methylcrotonyl-CoA carboxylase alpha subunit
MRSALDVMFDSVLIANRGEIACRIALTAKRLGLRTVAVYSEADANALHVRLCDEAHFIGPAPAAQSYLVIDKLIAVAEEARANCIHPGYGFLSENAAFASACRDAGIIFVGPPPEAILAMGLKNQAKTLMTKAGVPIVPGYHGDNQAPAFLKQKAYEIGYPIMIKAVAGGGGKGMRRVDRHVDFDSTLEGAMREAQSAFGDARILIEKYVTAPRHIEVQIFADNHGNVVHLNERDCSLQRRHQKIIEEAPALGVNASLRAVIGGAAVAAARAVDYVGAGTVEFIADGHSGLKEDAFWFMEMNTRLQVEHPVTEAVTGLDLVEWQFRVAAGEELPLKQKEVQIEGHAIEARFYAEDPERGFVPSTGRLIALQFPRGEGLRVDSGVEAGDVVTPFYDPMIAKLIVHAKSRNEAIDRLTQALEKTIVVGPRSNLALLAAIARAPAFRAGEFDTTFIDRHFASLGDVGGEIDRAAVACGIEALLTNEGSRLAMASGEGESPWNALDAFQLTGERRLTLPVIADGQKIMAQAVYGPRGVIVTVDGVKSAPDAIVVPENNAVYVLRAGRQTKVELHDLAFDEAESEDSGGLVRAPMHGRIRVILIEKGASVTRGQPVAIIEAMKMEHTLTAPKNGVVTEIYAAKNEQVIEGAKVMMIESMN